MIELICEKKLPDELYSNTHEIKTSLKQFGIDLEHTEFIKMPKHQIDFNADYSFMVIWADGVYAQTKVPDPGKGYFVYCRGEVSRPSNIFPDNAILGYLLEEQVPVKEFPVSYNRLVGVFLDNYIYYGLDYDEVFTSDDETGELLIRDWTLNQHTEYLQHWLRRNSYSAYRINPVYSDELRIKRKDQQYGSTALSRFKHQNLTFSYINKSGYKVDKRKYHDLQKLIHTNEFK